MEAPRHPRIPIYCIPTRCMTWVGNSTAHKKELRMGARARDSLAGMDAAQGLRISAFSRKARSTDSYVKSDF